MWQPDEAETLTQPGLVMGTVGYMSPEQVRGEPVRAPSDIFALGAVLYEMVAGRRAFGGGTAQDTLSAILRDDPRICPASARRFPATSLALSRIASRKTQRAFPVGPRSRIRVENRGERRIQLAGRVRSDRLDRRAAVHQREPRSRPRVLERRRHRNDHQPPDAFGGAAGHAAQYRFPLQGTDIDPQAAGREVGARVVLTGRILQRGDTLVVGAELIDVARESQLWGERFTRNPADIFSIEEELASKISESLRGTLTRDDRQRLTRRSTKDSEAYRFYLRGRHAYNRRTPASLQQSCVISHKPSNGIRIRVGVLRAVRFVLSAQLHRRDASKGGLAEVSGGRHSCRGDR